MTQNFSKISTEWWEFHKCKIKPASRQMYQSKLKAINEIFGCKDIKAISPFDVQAYLNQLADNNAFSRSTISKYRYTLNLIFKYAIISRYSDSNPVSSTKVPHTISSYKRKNLSQPEIDFILNNSKSDFGLYPIFLLYTGMRRSECLALRWEDINFEDKYISINKKVSFIKSQPIIENHLKNNDSERLIPLLEILIDYIYDIRKDNGYIFGKSDRDELYTQSYYDNYWKNYKKKNNISYTQHCLRHTYATMLYHSGIDIKTAQLFLGHKSISMTLDIYTHLDNRLQISKGHMIDEYIKKSEI